MADSHVLVVTIEPNGWRRYAVRCPGVTDECRGWEECRVPDCNAYEEGDDEVHGVEHRYIYEIGYATPTAECWLTGYSELAELARWSIGGKEWPDAGEYRFDVRWDRDGEPQLIEVEHG